jgi:alcohol dehydrogenase (cytochrome c)
MTVRSAVLCSLLVFLTAVAPTPGWAASNEVGAASYLGAEASEGSKLFQQQCTNCHLRNLAGSDVVPPLAGGRFLSKWKAKPVSELAIKIRDTMPPEKPKSLTEKASLELTAYLLRANRIPAGKISIAAIAATAPTSAATVETTTGISTPVFLPITDKTLQNPDPADWLNWRRTLDGWGYSPLKHITRDNVAKLQLAWAWTMPPGEVQPTPLIYRGIMYLSYANGVQALDAASGDLYWDFKLPASGTKRNIAIYDDKVFIHTQSGNIYALNAQSGKIVWDTKIADPAGKGYGFSSGAIVVNGKLVAGLTSCGKYKDDTCYIVAHDAKTGKELWRTSTVARPGEPGGDTWGDHALKFRAGSEAWLPGSYDPKLNLIYWGTAQAKPWAAAQRKFADAALYSNATLALNPDTGKIVWFYQHIPGESHDEDEVYEPILIDDGGKRSLFKMGKVGILWELDRQTGKFLSANDIGYQTLLNLDKKTGKVAYRPNVLPVIGKQVDYCPGPGGLKNLWSMSYHPETKAFYIPIKVSCAQSTFEDVPLVEGGGGNGPATRKSVRHPAAPNHIGEFIAMDSKTGEIKWRHRNRTAYDSAALATGGGLAFVGDMDRRFYAFDVNNGAMLWSTRLANAAEGYPVTYAVNGEQYVAITSGPGPIFISLDVDTFLPGSKRAGTTPTIHVFKLPASPPR